MDAAARKTPSRPVVFNFPFPPRPKPGDGADQRALPGARFPGDKHPLSRHNRDFGIIQHACSIVQRDGKIDEPQSGLTASFRDFDAADRIAALRGFQGIKRNH
jgi:hypothetical protein